MDYESEISDSSDGDNVLPRPASPQVVPQHGAGAGAGAGARSITNLPRPAENQVSSLPVTVSPPLQSTRNALRGQENGAGGARRRTNLPRPRPRPRPAVSPGTVSSSLPSTSNALRQPEVMICPDQTSRPNFSQFQSLIVRRGFKILVLEK